MSGLWGGRCGEEGGGLWGCEDVTGDGGNVKLIVGEGAGKKLRTVRRRIGMGIP